MKKKYLIVTSLFVALLGGVGAVQAQAGNVVELGSGPNSWNLNEGATNKSSTSNMQFTLKSLGGDKGGAASYDFASPVNWNGATLKLTLNFDQAFISDRNGGADAILQLYTYSAGWAASEFKCFTANQVLVAGQDTEFTCSDFSLQNAVGVGIQFPGAAGSVTIKKATIIK